MVRLFVLFAASTAHVCVKCYYYDYSNVPPMQRVMVWDVCDDGVCDGGMMVWVDVMMVR